MQKASRFYFAKRYEITNITSEPVGRLTMPLGRSRPTDPIGWRSAPKDGMERKNFSTRKEIGMEAAALVENSRTVDELESYFKAYTDLPREVVLKHE
jgi:hypothetical protein